MALSDDVERIVAFLIRERQGGELERLRYECFGLSGDAGRGKVAKAIGASVEQLRAIEDGLVTPPTQQALALLDYLRQHRPPPARAQTSRPVEAANGARP